MIWNKSVQIYDSIVNLYYNQVLFVSQRFSLSLPPILKTSFYFYYDKTIENRGACQAGARY